MGSKKNLNSSTAGNSEPPQREGQSEQAAEGDRYLR